MPHFQQQQSPPRRVRGETRVAVKGSPRRADEGSSSVAEKVGWTCNQRQYEKFQGLECPQFPQSPTICGNDGEFFERERERERAAVCDTFELSRDTSLTRQSVKAPLSLSQNPLLGASNPLFEAAGSFFSL